MNIFSIADLICILIKGEAP